MKSKLIPQVVILSGVWLATLALAHHRGYRNGHEQGVRDESACWVVEISSPEEMINGVVTAHRDMRQHPFFPPPHIATSGKNTLRKVNTVQEYFRP